jgi:hypothetical protein
VSLAVDEFLVAVVASLNGQGYRVDALEEPRALGTRNRAWRCSLRSPEKEMPRSVIVLRASGASDYQDWSCQYFLSDLAGTQGLGPEFFAADETLGFYLLEDLGLGADLLQALRLGDSRAELAAELLACGLAGLHAGTWGRERPFNILRGRLPGVGPDRRQEAQAWEGLVRPWVRQRAEGLDPLIDELRAEQVDPAEFLCLTHGRLLEHRPFYGDQGPRFLSFQHGAYRHALLDVACWELVPGWEPGQREGFRARYRQELALLGAKWEDRFDSSYARACAILSLEILAREGDAPALALELLANSAKGEGLSGLARLMP